MADRPNRPNRPIRPRQGAPAGRRKRRVVIDTGAARPRQDGRQRRDQQEQKPKEKTPVAPQTGPVTVESGVTVKDLSQALGVPVPKLITILMGLGAPKTVTILNRAVRIHEVLNDRQPDLKERILAAHGDD